MPVAQLNTSTLSEALTAATARFTVGSTTNITAGQILVIRNEAVKVTSIPVSGTVTANRGVNGTLAVPHASGQRFFIGDQDSFKAIRDSAHALVGGETNTFPDYLLPGQKATDGAGNEFVLVDLTATIYGGTTVLISMDGLFTAAILTDGAQGPVAVTVEGGTSAQYVWAQVYGSNAYAQETIGDSAGTSALLALIATTASTPSVGLAAAAASSFSSVVGEGLPLIHGMFITGIPTSATTSATSATGTAYPVWLNYPYVRIFPAQTAHTS